MHKPLWYHYWLFHERKGLFQNKGWCVHFWNDLTLMAKKKNWHTKQWKDSTEYPRNEKQCKSKNKPTEAKPCKRDKRKLTTKYSSDGNKIPLRISSYSTKWNKSLEHSWEISQREVGSLGNLKIREDNFSFPCTWGYFLSLRKIGICLLPKCILCTLPSSNMNLYSHIFSPHPSLILLLWLVTRSLSFWEKENVFCNTGFTKFQLVINYYFPNTDRMFAFLKVLRMHLPGGSRKITYPITASISSCDKIN